MKKLPDLADKIMGAGDDLKIEGLALLESLRCFKMVQEACFGQNLMKEVYEERIKRFSQTYRKLENMSITPKIHIIQHHVIDFLKRKGEEYGLGWWSEQAFEAVQSDMKKEWDKVKICDKNHPDFPQRLLDFVVRYNSKHL